MQIDFGVLVVLCIGIVVCFFVIFHLYENKRQVAPIRNIETRRISYTEAYRIRSDDDFLLRSFNLKNISRKNTIVTKVADYDRVLGVDCILASVESRLLIVPKSLLIPVSKQEEILMEVIKDVQKRR